MKETCKRFTAEPNSEIRKLVDAGYARWQQQVGTAVKFKATLQSRLIVGLGGKGPLEIGITLQHVTGLPIIPGSALKGLSRAYGLLTIAAQLNVQVLTGADWQAWQREHPNDRTPLEYLDEALAASDDTRKESMSAEWVAALKALPEAEYFRTAFGSQEKAGVCQFYDSVVAKPPPKKSLFEADVMTPHFRKYYEGEGKSAPHDGDSPNPVMFIAVASMTTFAFALGLRRSVQNDAVAQDARNQAGRWLEAGLSELGIGSKTAAGYGAFALSN